MAEQPKDIDLTCTDCGNTFVFNARDQEFFAQKGYSQPKRCVACRRLKKQRMQNRYETSHR